MKRGGERQIVNNVTAQWALSFYRQANKPDNKVKLMYSYFVKLLRTQI